MRLRDFVARDELEAKCRRDVGEMLAVWARPVTPKVAEDKRVEMRAVIVCGILFESTCYSRERL